MPKEEREVESPSELPRDLGAWTLTQGSTIDDFQKKSEASLANKMEVLKIAKSLRERFQGFRDPRTYFIYIVLPVSALVILICLNLYPPRVDFWLRLASAIFSALPLSLVVFKIYSFMKLERRARDDLDEIEKKNDVGSSGNKDPNSLELLSQTFLPSVKSFMEAYGAHATQEHLKDLIRNSLTLYGIYDDSIKNSLENAKRIHYSDSDMLNYLISTMKTDCRLDPQIALLAYYDYTRSPEARDQFVKMVGGKSNYENELLSTISNKLTAEYLPNWITSKRTEILTLIFNNIISKGGPFSINHVLSEFETIAHVLVSDQSLLEINLADFGIEVGSDFASKSNEAFENIESLKSGDYLRRCVYSFISKYYGGLTPRIIELIYHYRDSEITRVSKLRELNDTEAIAFARIIDNNVLHLNKAISEETLGDVLQSIGDYRVEKLKNSFGRILNLLELLDTAKESLKSLEFNVTDDRKEKPFLAEISKRMKLAKEEDWVSYSFEYFRKLTDWKSELNRKFPEREYVDVDLYAKILFIIFSNGKLHRQPSVDKISVNQHFSSEPNLELRLLRFIELSETGDPEEIPRIILESVDYSISDKDHFYLQLFHREFVRGVFPSYYFLVWFSSKGYQNESEVLTANPAAIPYKKVMDEIISTIFSMALSDEFIKSLLIGGAVKAYLLIKSSKKGEFFTLLDHGTSPNYPRHRFKTFSNFLRELRPENPRYNLLNGLAPDYYYRVDSSAFAVRLGMIPEKMSFSEFSASLDELIKGYFADVVLEINHSVGEGNANLRNRPVDLADLNWEILPLDISTVRKAIEAVSQDGKERGYINSIKKFLSQERVEKQLAWIGVMRTHGDDPSSTNLKSVISRVLQSDDQGYLRFLKFDSFHFEIRKKGEESAEFSLEISNELKASINITILDSLGAKNFLEACKKINSYRSGEQGKKMLTDILSKFNMAYGVSTIVFSRKGINFATGRLLELSSTIEILIE